MVASPPGATAGHVVVPARLVVLSCPPALCPHVEFAVASVLGAPVALRWTAQPALPGTLTAAADVAGAPGLASRLAGRLRALGPVRFEVADEAVPGCPATGRASDPERYSYTPDLGLFQTSLSASGDVMVGEGPLRALLEASSDRPGGGGAELAHGLQRLLGTAWDAELEPLRHGGAGAPVSWLRRTG